MNSSIKCSRSDATVVQQLQIQDVGCKVIDVACDISLMHLTVTLLYFGKLNMNEYLGREVEGGGIPYTDIGNSGKNRQISCLTFFTFSRIRFP